MVQRGAPPGGVFPGAVALVGEDELRAHAAVEELDRAPRAREDRAAAGEAHVELEQTARLDLAVLAGLDERRLTGHTERRLVAAADSHLERVDRERHPIGGAVPARPPRPRCPGPGQALSWGGE